MDGEMPPMGGDPNMGADPNMGGDMIGMDPNMPMGDPQMQIPADNGAFDTNFDAGVEADEEQDPKRFIQQLTGKLSQSLRKYNETLPQPDVDLDKYVAGMIVKQAIEGLSPEDTKDILDKVKSGDVEDNPEGNAEGGQPAPAQEPAEQMPAPAQVPFDGQESKKRSRKKSKLDELLIQGEYERRKEADAENEPKTKGNGGGIRKKALSSPELKK